MYKKGRAWIELDTQKLEKNVAFFRRILPKGCRLMPAVKADAYGHGALLVTEKLQEMGISDFCVASVREGCQLRAAGIAGQILVLGYTHPRNLELLETYRLTQTVVDYAYAKVLQASGRRLLVHVGIDTGMHRLGMEWDKTGDIIKICRLRGLRVTGVYSHLCVADGKSAEDERFTRLQIAHFREVTDRLHAAGLQGFCTHLQGSYGILNYPECSCDCARPGIALYGILSRKDERTKLSADLHPVLSLKARIGCIRRIRAGEGAGYGLAFVAERDTRLAVLQAGYADGIPAGLAERGYVLICGRAAPIAGRICMDQMLVDVTDIPEAEPEGEAVLIGVSGEHRITVEQYAEWTGTIANEIVSRLGARLERVAV